MRGLVVQATRRSVIHAINYPLIKMFLMVFCVLFSEESLRYEESLREEDGS